MAMSLWPHFFGPLCIDCSSYALHLLAVAKVARDEQSVTTSRFSVPSVFDRRHSKQEFEQEQHYSAADLHFLDFYQLLSFGYQSSIVIPRKKC